jgi:hypothetical protein
MLKTSAEDAIQTRGRRQMALIRLVPRTCELASRESNGLKVTLFWDRPTDQLTVCVSDVRSDAYFELDAERHNALEVPTERLHGFRTPDRHVLGPSLRS